MVFNVRERKRKVEREEQGKGLEIGYYFGKNQLLRQLFQLQFMKGLFFLFDNGFDIVFRV